MTVPVDVGFKNESKCCGGSPTENTNACCLEDEKAKKLGKEGCGCTVKSEPTSENVKCCS
ncbi:hypothetical protein [Lentilitoribacter sp. Alg239-R112]|jgi:hypothetical protein|uniref:hypothetical protein n=1 Tax=Lentilitoribacter sp. Alg239-R112 TaxID=2305987 RepID=UPI0013A6BB80|nr:hypothetical protein [Lentilitoribacter sp. Alg239-R112]